MYLLLTLEVTQKKNSPDATSTPHPYVSPQISLEVTPTPKPLTVDRLEALPQMQRTDFCKHISKHLLNCKAPQHETDIFTHAKGLLYKHIMYSGKQFLPLLFQDHGSIWSWWKLMTH